MPRTQSRRGICPEPNLSAVDTFPSAITFVQVKSIRVWKDEHAVKHNIVKTIVRSGVNMKTVRNGDVLHRLKLYFQDLHAFADPCSFP